MCEISAVLSCHLHACKLLASYALLFLVSAVEYFMKVWWAKTHHLVKLDHLSLTPDLSWPSSSMMISRHTGINMFVLRSILKYYLFYVGKSILDTTCPGKNSTCLRLRPLLNLDKANR